MALSAQLAALGEAQFVALTTFRRTGEGVVTPVWVAREGETLVVTTPAGTGKLKRLRNDPRVELRPCSRLGRIEEDAAVVGGRVELRDDDGARESAHEVLREKYGAEFAIAMGVEGVAKRVRRSADRVILRITD